MEPDRGTREGDKMACRPSDPAPLGEAITSTPSVELRKLAPAALILSGRDFRSVPQAA